jgi:polysaccharide export outer membrane protein
MRVLLALLFFGLSLATASAQQALRPGDAINISVWQDPKLDRTVVIGPDGYIGFPLVGQVKASGLTPRALEDVLRSRLAKNYTGQLDVTVALSAVNRELEDETKPKVYVSGEVLRPGPLFARPTINIAQAIALAGGLSPFAASRRIQIHRQTRGVDEILLFDYKAFQAGIEPNNNIALRSGDVIIVPERGFLE